MGGTFDHLHRGHRQFIEFAASLAEKVVIGVTDSAMTEHKLFPQLIETHTARIESVKSLCDQREISAEVVVLHDVYGPTVTSSKIDALAVTEETVAGGAAINAQRVKLGLPPLPVHIFSLVRDAEGAPITSTRIRAGEIDREGFLYKNVFSADIQLTERQRNFFVPPQGDIVSTAPAVATVPTFVVGDACLVNFHDNNWQFHTGWFDGKSERKQLPDSKWPVSQTVASPAGQLSNELFQHLRQIISATNACWAKGQLPKLSDHIFVSGEEDLVTVGLGILAPIGSVIYYGQPGQGMVKVAVTPELKQRFSQVFVS